MTERVIFLDFAHFHMRCLPFVLNTIEDNNDYQKSGYLASFRDLIKQLYLQSSRKTKTINKKRIFH